MENFQFAVKNTIRKFVIGRHETSCRTIDDIIAVLTWLLESDLSLALLSVFDNHAHAIRCGTTITADIQSAKCFVWCSSPGLLDTSAIPLQIHAIGIADLGNRFAINYEESPYPAVNQMIQSWISILSDPDMYVHSGFAVERQPANK